MSNTLNTYVLKENEFNAIKLYNDKDTFIDDKDLISVIKSIEKIIRQSNEYKSFITYIRDTFHMSNCKILSGIDTNSAKIEIHHNIFTLFDYCKIIINYCNQNNIKWNSFIIADMVLELHYRNLVNLIPLSTTMHQYTHSNKLYYEPTQCLGNLSKFIEEYSEYLDEQQLEKLNEINGNYINVENIIPKLIEQ